MAADSKVTTDDYSPNIFHPHGRVEFSVVDNNILVCEAIGPFNLELISAVVTVQSPLIAHLMKQGKWGDIVIFKSSAMASAEVVSSFAEYLRSLSTALRMPSATALVIAPELEGARIMTQHYQKCYEDAGLQVVVFATFDEALLWVKTRINS